MRVLVPLDGSDQAWKAFEVAVDLARARGGELLCLHVVRAERPAPSLQALARAEGLLLEEEIARRREALALGDDLTREAERRAHSMGLDQVRGIAAAGDTADEILTNVRDEEVDAIVMGMHGGHGILGRGLLGGGLRKVARQAPCTCVFVK